VSRSLWPIDETRYASVAWEMWLRKDLLVPRLTGEPYGDKPPLLFWVLDLGWIAGVNAWWPRLVPFLFTLGVLVLTARLARTLWPARPLAHRTAPLLLAGAPFWDLYGTFLLADMLLVFAVASAILGLWIAAFGGDVRDSRARERGQAIGWLVFAVALGGGALAKGPVILVHTLPAALLAPWWAGGDTGEETAHGSPTGRGRWLGWYAFLVLALSAGAALALAWALPAAAAGGPAYRSQILWAQTADRVVHSFAHARPFWWYLPLLPIAFFPWSFWPAVWRSLSGLRKTGLDPGLRLCVSWIVPTFFLLSAISGKQPHYLLPLLPGLALLVGRALGISSPRRSRGFVLPLTVLAIAGLVVAGLPRLWADELFGLAPFWVTRVSPWWGLAIVALALVCGAWASRCFDAPGRARALAVAGATALILIELGPARLASRGYDVTPLARHLSVLEREGSAVANLGTYAGQYDFAGRLERRPEEITAAEVMDWVATHPKGRVVVYYRTWMPASALPSGRRYGGGGEPPVPSSPDGRSRGGKGAHDSSAAGVVPRPEFAQAYRGRAAAVWSSAVLRSHPQLIDAMP
jgi:4-amino-4-deoxy-L-arabinose transferase-like glycosyltransferase